MSDFFTVAVIGLHLGSAHVPAGDYNDFNPGAYVANAEGYVAGGYYNSQQRLSLYAGRTLPIYGPVSVTLGAVTGYDYGPVAPLVAPSVTLGGWRLTIIPKTPVTDAAVAHLSFEWTLEK